MQLYRKYKFLFNTVLKSIVVCLLFWAIYKQVVAGDQLATIYNQLLSGINPASAVLLGVTFLLVFVNWGVEAYKWQILINQRADISFFTSYKAVLGGLSLASVTPNRVGEYIGRVFFVDGLSKGKAISLTLVGIFSQILVTCLVGFIGLNYYLYTYSGIDSYLLLAVIFMSLFLLLLLILLYYSVAALPRWTAAVPLLKRVQKYIDTLRKFRRGLLHYLLFVALVRYIVFTAQYLLLLSVFGISVPLWEGFLLIGLIFFVQMAIPYPALAELGVRGNVALFFLSGTLMIQNKAGIVSAAFGLWIFNIIIPAVIGSYFVLKQKFF